jgi:hypothetical protein
VPDKLEVPAATLFRDNGEQIITLTKATFIQRVNTAGGLAPSTGCGSLADVGKQAFRPYRADYSSFAGPETDDSH